MTEDDKHEYITTAEAVVDIATRGLAAVRENSHADAAMLYSLANQFTKSLALVATVHASNELKREVLPEDQLVQEDTGITNPLTGEQGQYL